MSGKREKMAFRDLGRVENGKKWLSEASDEWKTAKNGFPGARMSGKREKKVFPTPRRAKECRKTLVVG